MSTKEFIAFGTGSAIFIPKRDADGNAITVPTPIELIDYIIGLLFFSYF